MKKNRNIICFGETLWDVFPDEKRPGGAPMNVAVHLRKFGFDPFMVSRVGGDELGDKLKAFLQDNGLSTDHIQRDGKLPTGVVNVQVAESGDASYDIVFPSAWDFIEYPEGIPEEGIEESMLVFGSLASRHEISKRALLQLLQKANTKLFDVNFRAPHYTRDLIELLLENSDIVKLNEHELKIIGEWHGFANDDLTELCAPVADYYDFAHMVLTLGGDGAFAWKEGKGHRQPGFKVEVKDTVGSGDSFLAAYIANYLNGKPIEHCLKIACATGAYVASNHGAVPDYQISDIESLAGSAD